MATQTAPRVQPIEEPYDPKVAETLRRMMPPGVEPLKLFTTIAHNPAILDRFRSIGAYILNFGQIEPLEREIVIHRTTARNGCEYEWGVHVVAFGRPLGLTEEQLRATLHGDADDPAWSERQSLLVRLVDELHDTGTRVRRAVAEARRRVAGIRAGRAGRNRRLLPPGLVCRQRPRRRARGLRRTVSRMSR